MGAFPFLRLRRNRKTQFIRDLVQENHVTTKDLVYPVFVLEGVGRKDPILSMPSQNRISLDNLLFLAEECVQLGIPALALFPVIEGGKNLSASESYNENGLVPKAIKLLKQNFPELGIFTDIALDPYTIHGQDGIIDEFGYVLNDVTNQVLVKQALCHARAGADFVCPSDMMDGRVGLIRKELEANNFHNVGIIAYSAKYASKLYKPFRDAVGSSVNLGQADKLNYQINPANSNEAVFEAFLDIQEGADILMVKPGMPYLDIVYRIKSEFKKPVATYQISGEYAMLKAAEQNGWLDYNALLLEMMLCFKRAGSDMIWTYSALDVAKLLIK